MQTPPWPRLSDAKTLLPRLRAHLAGAAPRYSLPVNISIDLLPIVEDGLFGYELVPDRNTHTYLTIGCCETGEGILRRTMSADPPSASRLAATDGKSVLHRNFSSRHSIQRHDSRFVKIFDSYCRHPTPEVRGVLAARFVSPLPTATLGRSLPARRRDVQDRAGATAARSFEASCVPRAVRVIVAATCGTTIGIGLANRAFALRCPVHVHHGVRWARRADDRKRPLPMRSCDPALEITRESARSLAVRRRGKRPRTIASQPCRQQRPASIAACRPQRSLPQREV
jgi:hypothetical protein